MKTGLYGQQLTLMEELKAATFQSHARLQALPFFQSLAACQLPLESYVGQLRALAAIHGVLEQAIECSTDHRLASVWSRDMRKVPQLQQDLRYFEPRAVADLKEATEGALKTAGNLRLLSVEQPLALLGWLYVLEGSTLGAQVLRRLYSRAFLLTEEDGLAYLATYGAAVHAHWAQYQQRMNALDLSASDRELVVQAAGGSFVQLETVFQALYPFRPESKIFLVTSINPEAGRHPIPADAREVQASLRAADRIWQQFPYFEQRYGERGRRFARSDAAWQATLCQFDTAQIGQQVRWLGRVLAARGMPTVLLQIQLEILVEELTAAIPEKKADYAKLLLAGAELHDARRRHLTDEQVEEIAGQFDRAAGPEWSTRLPHTGALLVGAVVDELEGCDGAVDSLRSWMTDAVRFPGEWAAAVEATLDAARRHARRIVDAAVKNP